MHFSALAILPALAALATASPAPDLRPRARSGDLTYYTPGLGACGGTNGDDDLIVAVSAPLYDAQKPCGRSIHVTGPAGSVTVAVVDRCAGCQADDLDLSPAAFKKAVGDLGAGRVAGSWDWA